MKHVPFYPNTDDDRQCMVSVYRMLAEYFLHKKLSQAEMAEIAGRKDNVTAWSVTPLITFSRLGFDIRMIEPFDYRRYQEIGEPYLDGYFTPEEKAWQTEHTNILDIRQYIPEFLRTIGVESRAPTLDDIDAMLAENRLIFAGINARALDGKKGYYSHAILIIQRDDTGYIVHDPGLPPRPYRHITRDQLWNAMGGEHNIAEVTGFIYRKAHVAKRLDSYVVAQKPRLSRAFAAKLIEQGKVLVNGEQRKPGYKVRDDDTITIDYNDAELDMIPPIDLPILYEDDDCIVINKPAGVLTHSQGALNPEATVATFLRNRVIGLAGERAGVVHRLDRATSGIIIGAKHQAALSFLQKQFADRKAKKTYMAIVEGTFKQPTAVIDMPIERNPKAPATFRVGPNGKSAVTRYNIVQANSMASLVELQPQTGRTHQLRVHMAHLGHPIVGDPLYGHGAYSDRLYLHAARLEITLPNGEHKTFTAPLPKEFEGYTA